MMSTPVRPLLAVALIAFFTALSVGGRGWHLTECHDCAADSSCAAVQKHAHSQRSCRGHSHQGHAHGDLAETATPDSKTPQPPAHDEDNCSICQFYLMAKAAPVVWEMPWIHSPVIEVARTPAEVVFLVNERRPMSRGPPA